MPERTATLLHLDFLIAAARDRQLWVRTCPIAVAGPSARIRKESTAAVNRIAKRVQNSPDLNHVPAEIHHLFVPGTENSEQNAREVFNLLEELGN